MDIAEFDYDLPKELIAQMPAQKRDNSRMLVLNRANHSYEDKHFYDISEYLSENDLLVLNNTKVIPARLYGVKESTGALIEVFLLEKTTQETLSSDGSKHQLWDCLIKPSKRIKQDTIINICDELKIVPVKKLEDAGEWSVELVYKGNLMDILRRVGNIPLPPYIERKNKEEGIKNFDMERYQTVYAKDEGSVAAPTAGLHFTNEILDKLRAKGVETTYITLNVGLGTFRPVMCSNILNHKMHSETFEISEEASEKINQAKKSGKNIVAVGTTTVRTLETAMQKFGEIKPCNDSSKLFIYPPYKFKIIDKMITNFHLPKSTLLMLVSAFAGKDFVFDSYKHAVDTKYRFFSYGDCMFIN